MTSAPSSTATVADLVRDMLAYGARSYPNRLACRMIDDNRGYSYKAFDDLVSRCAAMLADQYGVKDGDRVAILARNSYELFVLHYACIRMGAIFVPLNWRLAGPELGALLKDSTPVLFFYQDEFAGAARTALEAFPMAQAFEFSTEDGKLLAAMGACAPADMNADDLDVNRPVTFLYTSGTTGRSKGVIVTALNANMTALNFAICHEVAPRDVLVCDVPMFHVAGLFGVARAAIHMGGTVIMAAKFDPVIAIDILSDPELKVSHSFMVPQMAVMMQKHEYYPNADLTRMKAIVCGGAPIPPSVTAKYLEDGVILLNGYGLSEAGSVLAVPIDPAITQEKCGSAGVVAPYISVRLVDQDDNDVTEPGAVGEIWLKGPSMTPGYWQQPEATAAAFSADGWFKTGDAATCDKDGFYTIVDRWKDMFISGGENVYPAEVEAALIEMDAIGEAAVIGVADDRWGEVGCAYVGMRAGYTTTPEEIIAYCKKRLAPYKVPKLVRIIDVLPRTGSGKVQKQDLRALFAKEQ